MATSTSFPVICILVLSFMAGELFTMTNGQRTWCIAKPSANDTALNENINYACQQVNCNSVLQRGSSCFTPDSLINHASVVMNLYYKAKGGNKWNCDFKTTALIVVTDPSYDKCVYGR